MILQCDQCNTKFKLDDGKIKDGGVKVRCSKCKHVFTVTKKDQEEVADFDALLNTLGKAAPESGINADSAPSDDFFGQQDGPISGPHVDVSIENQILAEVGKNEEDSSAAGGDEGFDLSDFNPSDEPIADIPPRPVDNAQQSEGNSFDLSDFDFNAEEEPATSTAVVGEKKPDLEKVDSYNDFQFTEQSLPSEAAEEENPSEGTALDFGDLSFDDEPLSAPASVSVDVAADTGAGFDLDSFAFDPADEASPGTFEQAATDADFLADTAEPFASEEDLNFSEQDSNLPEAPQSELFEDSSPEPPMAEGPGEFSFDFSEDAAVDEPPTDGATSIPPATDKLDGLDVPDFSFSDSAPYQSQEPIINDQVDGKKDLDDIDFGQVVSPAIAKDATKPGLPLDGLVDMDEHQSKDSGFSNAVPSYEDELPPLSIGSRRKENSIFTVVGIVVAVVGLLVLTGGGLFLLSKDPSIFKKAGLGSVTALFDKKNAEDGRIVIANPNGEFIINKAAGELFVISGEAVNQFKKPRASLQVKATLFGNNGAVAMQSVAYCGNKLSREQLESLPLEKLETAMNNQFGDSLSNLGVQPGKAIPFVVVFSKVPDGVVEFGVDVAGSTVASP